MLSHKIRAHVQSLLTVLILGIFCSTVVSAQTVHNIYGTGFSPTSLKKFQRLPPGTSLVEADEKTVLILKREWKIESGKCIEMVVIGNSYYYLDQDPGAQSDTDCRVVGDATAVGRAMDGDSVNETIRMSIPDVPKSTGNASGDKDHPHDPSKSDDWSGADSASMLKQLNNDIGKLKQRAMQEAQQQKAKEAAKQRQAKEAAKQRQAEEAAKQRPTEFKCALSGRIVDQDTGEPLAGVGMDLYQSPMKKRSQALRQHVTTTGAAGDFIIDCSSISESSYPLLFGLHSNNWLGTKITGPDVERKGTRNGLVLKVRTGPAPLLPGELVRFSSTSQQKGDSWFATGKVSNVSGRHLACVRLRFKMSTSFQDKQRGVPDQDLGILEVEVRNLAEGEERPYWKAMPKRVGKRRAHPPVILCK